MSGARSTARPVDAEPAVRHRKLARVDLNVLDVERSARFYRDVVGLQRVDADEPGTAAFRCDVEPVSVVLHAAREPGLKRIGWMLDDAASLDALRARLAARRGAFSRIDARDAHGRERAGTIRIVEHATGATLDFSAPPAGPCGPAFEPTHTRIQRLGHVVLATPRHDDAVGFFRDTLGFRESDRIERGTTFMRPHPSPYHHGLGIGRAPTPRCHHVNFMVTEIDDIGRALHRLARHDVPVVFGPGRHPGSGSVFLYFLDPDGLTLEYSFGMETFDASSPRAPADLPASPRSVDAWGAPRDPRMGAIGTIEASVVSDTAN